MRHATILTLLFLAGCGDAGPVLVPLRGKVLQNGRPLTLAAGEHLIVRLFPDGEGADPGLTLDAVTNPDGTFSVPGPQGKGAPQGRYRFAVSLLGGEGPAAGRDRLKDAYSPAKTPFILSVAPGGPEVTLDLKGM
jgi:hypothetical protein